MVWKVFEWYQLTITDSADSSCIPSGEIKNCSFTYNDQYSPLNTASRSVNNKKFATQFFIVKFVKDEEIKMFLG